MRGSIYEWMTKRLRASAWLKCVVCRAVVYDGIGSGTACLSGSCVLTGVRECEIRRPCLASACTYEALMTLPWLMRADIASVVLQLAWPSHPRKRKLTVMIASRLILYKSGCSRLKKISAGLVLGLTPHRKLEAEEKGVCLRGISATFLIPSLLTFTEREHSFARLLIWKGFGMDDACISIIFYFNATRRWTSFDLIPHNYPTAVFHHLSDYHFSCAGRKSSSHVQADRSWLAR